MSEMIKSAAINCFSMWEERSSSSNLPPHPLPPRPQVFDAVSIMAQALQSILKPTWCRLFGFILDVRSYFQVCTETSCCIQIDDTFFLPSMEQKWSLNMELSGWRPKLIQKCRVVEVTTCKISIGWGITCLCRPICDLFLWKVLSSTR